MRTPLLLTFVALAVISCSTRVETVTTFHAQYQYALAYPTEDVHAGEVRSLVWKATQAAWSAQQPPPLRLCFALMGAYANVQDLKTSNQTSSRPSCPISGRNVVFASDALVADATSGTDLIQELRLPADLAPGYYNIVQVSAYDDGNAMSGAGIMHVVARP